jgi:hypothetical protein
MNDDNEEILDLLKKRLELGKNKYNHGVIINQDTTQFGTEENDWICMAEEEMLDGLIYITANMIRHRRKQKEDEFDCKKIMSFFNKIMQKHNSLYNENKMLKYEIEELKKI